MTISAQTLTPSQRAKFQTELQQLTAADRKKKDLAMSRIVQRAIASAPAAQSKNIKARIAKGVIKLFKL
jgi:hypothetical protein